MFEGAFVENGGGSRKSWSVALSFLIQSLFVSLAVVLPLLSTGALPAQQAVGFLLAPPPPVAAPPLGAVAQSEPVRRPTLRVEDSAFRAPVAIPEKVALLSDVEQPTARPAGVPGVLGAGGSVPSADGGMGPLGGLSIAPPREPETPRAPQPAAPGFIKVGGKVQAARLVAQTRPAYPPLARQARVSGTVRLEAVIAGDGGVRELRVISGHPLLVQSALDAVRQWRYQPTLLNGVAVEVHTHIEVHYTLR